MTTKNSKKTLKAPHYIIEKSSIDYSKDPFFIKKNEKAAAFIKKFGIPEHFLKKNS